MSKTQVTYKEGICPKCKSSNLKYVLFDVVLFDDSGAQIYPFVCGDCELEGQEHCNRKRGKLVYIKTTNISN